MKILLITSDLYKTIGGGQTVYKKIIESAANIEFYYFVSEESINAKRPLNANPIRLKNRRSLDVLSPSPYSYYKVMLLREADQYARSVAGLDFDIVDTPDFYAFGNNLRVAFAHHHVKIRRFVLAMHGNISKSKELNWDLNWGINWSDNLGRQLELSSSEQEQFKAADCVYGISPKYIKDWQTQFGRDVTYIDPLYFVDASINRHVKHQAFGKPSLYCIGRSERRKGNDLFVELVRWLDRDSFKEAAHIGDRDYSLKGIASSDILENIAKQRDVDIKYMSTMNKKQMHDLYAERSIVILPVRYDTLNLVALEALFSGCPIAISERAGVCDYLDQFHPELPYVKINYNNLYSAVNKIKELIENYDQHRAALLNYLQKTPPFSPESLDMSAIYQSFIEASINDTIVGTKVKIHYEERVGSFKARMIRLITQVMPRQIYLKLRRFILNYKYFILEKIIKSEYLGDAKFIRVLIDAKSVPARLDNISEHSESSIQGIRNKLNKIYENASCPLYRCNFWQEIARLERILGNELMAVTYELRILRLLGDDRLGLLPSVLDTLNKNGFSKEAEVAEAIFASTNQSEERVYSYLKASFQRNLVRQEKPWQLMEDQRNVAVPKVSVIVSLYKAASKLNFFLTALSQQTLLKQGHVEIILVDSGSPTNEREVVAAYLAHTSLNAVYARSSERETIQSAWNRGIGLARGPYLVFLGVDETLYPEALETLASQLDENPNIDWVMANSLVTSVEENGVFASDIMSYTRDGGSKDHTYLETCYLSWVGGMYRSSLHTRFGYYDETFAAAGDTEIKNRILPHINVKFIPQVLGLFLNYPDGQTTASPRAEIEDLRAWYAHRAPGGIRYAYENRSNEELLKQMHLALGYRKSYCGHMSSDIEYATNITKYLKTKIPNLAIANEVLPLYEKMLAQLRELEFANTTPDLLRSMLLLIKAWRTATGYQKMCRVRFKSNAWPCFSVFNDNRYEQHSWLWKSQ